MTVYPTAYVAACSTAVLASTATITSFNLTVKHLVGTALTDKAFTAAVSPAVVGCTATYTYALWYISPLSGATTTNPWATWFTQTTGTLSYKSPPASELNGNAYLDLNFKIVMTLD